MTKDTPLLCLTGLFDVCALIKKLPKHSSITAPSGYVRCTPAQSGITAVPILQGQEKVSFVV